MKQEINEHVSSLDKLGAVVLVVGIGLIVHGAFFAPVETAVPFLLSGAAMIFGLGIAQRIREWRRG
jgi:hypothetical protein